MAQSISKKLALPAILGALCFAGSASAGVLTFQGATFTTTDLGGGVLQIEVDADPSHLLPDWDNAVYMDAIGVKDIGSFTTVSATGPGGAWTFSPFELNADGCPGPGSPSGQACFTHAPVALADDMIFTLTYSGGTQDFTSPHLKVRFLDSDFEKTGSLMSLNVPGIPEPETYALMLAGLGVVGFVARRRQQNQG